MYDIDDLLYQIEEELKNGKKSLFGSGVTIDADAIYAIVDKIRASLPDVIREAKAIVRNSDRRYQEEGDLGEHGFSQQEFEGGELVDVEEPYEDTFDALDAMDVEFSDMLDEE